LIKALINNCMPQITFTDITYTSGKQHLIYSPASNLEFGTWNLELLNLNYLLNIHIR